MRPVFNSPGEGSAERRCPQAGSQQCQYCHAECPYERDPEGYPYDGDWDDPSYGARLENGFALMHACEYPDD